MGMMEVPRRYYARHLSLEEGRVDRSRECPSPPNLEVLTGSRKKTSIGYVPSLSFTLGVWV